MMKKFYLVLISLLAISQGWSQNTAIPDAAFEQYLISQGWDDTIDGQVLTANINGVTYLDIYNQGISSLVGIKDFTALEELSCSNNSLTSLDVSNMPNLVQIRCYNNSLTSLNISGLNLNHLETDGNQLTSVDVSSCTNLQTLWIAYNPIASINLGNNVLLENLYAGSCQLTTLNLSGLTNLQLLQVNNNQLENLDLKGLTALTNMDAVSNPLTCITVDNVAAAEAQSNWNIDSSMNYNTVCATPGNTAIPDAAFEAFLIGEGYDTVLDGLVATDNIANLTALNVSSQGISSLRGIEDFTALQNLNCSNNQLESLDVTMLFDLVEFRCNNNQLTSLSLSNLNSLQTLNFSNNTITNIDLSNTTQLTSLNCANNGLESLSLIGLNNLLHLDCQDNYLTELDITGSTLNTLAAQGNTFLNCIQVTDVSEASSNSNWTIDPASSYNTTCSSPLFFVVPDASFEQALIDLGYDDVVDGMVLKSNAAAVTSLDVSSKNIASLTGIGNFTSLTALNCSNNSLQVLSTSNLSALVTLNCANNELVGLSLEGMINLESLNASTNQIASIDLTEAGALKYVNLDHNQIEIINIDSMFNLEELHFASNDTKEFNMGFSYLNNLKKIYCNNNKLEYLYLSNFSNLEYVDSSYNELSGTNAIEVYNLPLFTYLDISHNDIRFDSFFLSGFASLETIICNDNDIDENDWSWGDFPAIKHFDCSNNKIKLLGALPSTLITLDCSSNRLTALDVSATSNLTSVIAQHNKFIVLDLNNLSSTVTFDCTSNPTLTCIQVADVDAAASNTNWTKDATANYTTDCSYALYVSIPDPVFEQALINEGYDNDNGTTLDGRILIASAQEATMLYIQNYGITDLTGISAFTGLEILRCNGNQIGGTLDLTGLTELQDLDCSFNNLTGLNVQGLTSLEILETRYNSLTTLDVSGLTALKEVYCGTNDLTDLDISGTTLERLDCYSNAFTTLDLTSLPASANMSCFDNQSLACIQVSDVAVADNNSNWTKDQDSLYALNCGGVTLIPDPNFEQALIDNGYDDVIDGQVATGIIMAAGYIDATNYGITDMTGLQDFKSIVALECGDNEITTLSLEGLENLVFLRLDNNQVSSLDLSQTPNLEQLYCQNNQITALDFTGLDHFTGLDCSNNQIATLDLSGLTDMVQINTSNNPLTSLNLEGATGLLAAQSNNTMLTTLDVLDSSLLEYLEVYGNQLTSLDVTGLTSLEYLDCGENQITNMDVTSLTNLIEYYCYDNQLTSINVTGLTNLKAISCSSNQITDLDEATLVDIEYLDAANNLLTELDLTQMPALEVFSCAENNMTALDLTGTLYLEYMDCRLNPLTCIKVIDVDTAGANAIYYKDDEDSYSLECDAFCSQTVTWDGNAWTPSNPLPDQRVVIAGNYTSTGDMVVCELEVTGTAIVTIASGHNLTVAGAITVEPTASLIFNNNANLLQNPMTKNNTNTGSITYNKNSSAVYNLDYTIWSSPTTGAQTLKDFSPFTLDASFFVYNTALNAYSNYLSQSGVFGGNPNVVTFAKAKGYLVRMPAGLPADVASVYNGAFTGVPNNGDVSIALSTAGSAFNAVGNPYPSPINIHDFINVNADQLDNGTLYFWRKRNLAPTTTYATITKLAYVATDEAMNTGTSFTGNPANWVINPGQGFLVKASSTATNLLFDNRMRVGVHNGQFFRPSISGAQTLSTESPTGISRIGLNIKNDGASFGQAVIGYTNETTNGLDFGWDGRLYNDADLSLYTKNQETKLAIQARAAFTENDVVPLSYKTNNGGVFTINLNSYDGLFEGEQNVYLKDNVFNTWHNLKEEAYTFSSETGTFDNRFEIHYVNSELGVEQPVLNADNVIIYKEGTVLNIDAGRVTMKEISIYDMRGRLIYSNDAVDTSRFAISNLMVEQQVLVVQITAEDNTKVSKKIIY